MSRPAARIIRVELEAHHARTIAIALETQIRIATEKHGLTSPPARAAVRAREHFAAALGVPPASRGKVLLGAIRDAFTEKGQP